MEARLVALKLFLDELGVSTDITTIDDRKKLQKAVYLAQIGGWDLGYRYGWYLMGPYSPSLAKDYYSLAPMVQQQKDHFQQQKLAPQILENLRHRVKPLMTVPSATSQLNQAQWLELVASLLYLRKNGMTVDKAKEILADKKPTLVPFAATAEQALRAVELV